MLGLRLRFRTWPSPTFSFLSDPAVFCDLSLDVTRAFIWLNPIVLYILNNTISAEEVEERREELFILDIRPSYSFEEAHIEGSSSLPIYDQLQGGNFIGLNASLEMLPEDGEIVVVCFSGVTASIAADYLRQRGFDALSLTGGMSAWESTTAGVVSASATA